MKSQQNLRNFLKKIGKWEDHVNRAIDIIRKSVVENVKKPKISTFYYNYTPDSSMLVRVLLGENMIEEAWRAAKEGECSDALCLKLADKRAAENIDESSAIYRNIIEKTIGRTNNKAYREAYNLLHNFQNILEHADMGEDFWLYVEDLKVKFKIKRNMMKLLKTI